MLNARKNKNNIYRANFSPEQVHLAALNGKETSFFSDKLPTQFKNRPFNIRLTYELVYLVENNLVVRTCICICCKWQSGTPR